MENNKITELFQSQIKVLNIGPELFHDTLAKQGVAVMQVEWRPPLDGDERLMDIIRSLKHY